MRNKKQWVSRPLYIISILIVVLCISIVVALYMMQDTKNGILDTENFYFTSDLLKEESQNAEYFIDPLATLISFDLYNYADSKRKTVVDISYEIEVINGTADPSKGTILLGDKKVTIDFTPSTDDNVTVKAKSTTPYEKVIQATFIRELGNQCKIEDDSKKLAAVLIMICSDDSKEIELSLPPEVIPDANDSRVNYLNGKYTFKSPGKGVYSLILLKSNTDLKLVVDGKFANKIEVKTQ